MAVKRIPRKHVFPGGFTVDIVFVDSKPEGESKIPDTLGLYFTKSSDAGCIELWKGLTPRQRWRILMHEMLHALADAQRWAEGQAGYDD